MRKECYPSHTYIIYYINTIKDFANFVLAANCGCKLVGI